MMRTGTAIRTDSAQKIMPLFSRKVDAKVIEKRKKLFFESSTTQNKEVEKRKNGKQLSEKEKKKMSPDEIRKLESAQAKEIFIDYKLRASMSLPQQLELVKKLTPEDAEYIIKNNHANGFHIELSVRIAITAKAHESEK